MTPCEIIVRPHPARQRIRFPRAALVAFFGAMLGSSPVVAQEEGDPVPADTQPSHPIAGSWRWNFTMPDGSTSRPKLTLSMDGQKLRGTTSFRPESETPITNVVFTGRDLRFQVIRHRNGRAIVTTYSGTWQDREIKGKIESDWNGEKQTYDWLAQRAHIGAEGTWRWPVTIRGREFQARVELEQDGETLTGWMPGRRRKIEIKNGSLKNGEVYFEVERGTGDEKVVTIYKGKQNGDSIKGTIETTTADGEERKSDWDARRTD